MRFQTLFIALAVGLANANTFHPFSLDPAAEIRNVLAHYCLILDTKTYSDLSSVYTPDAIANFTTIGLGVLSGLPAIQKAMNSSLFGIPTQHAMTTSYISDIKKNEANIITYYTLEQFGTGERAGQLFTVWGKWEDQLVNDGGWKVKNRQVVAMGGPLIGSFVVPSH
ncbi:SnoaL-like domain-containing protein [Rhexocercosporidium sp. MPI-PUGE-AT-0058]|nr:SnoaL-like domain-containing protein [Rhexocercosporidium sp. MPI-PUGE-AT-0058]